MFLGYQNNNIAFIAETKEELMNLPCVTLDKIEETSDEYVNVNGKFLKKDEAKVDIAIANRVSEYPPLEEQLDMIYHDMEEGTTVWHDLIKSIKNKYPKE